MTIEAGWRRAEWPDDCCTVCPAQELGLGEFDVADRPLPSHRFDAETGRRVDAVTGVAVCVHPFRVGLPAGCYASAGEPLPVEAVVPAAKPRSVGVRVEMPAVRRELFTPTAEHLVLPDQEDLLEGWLVAILRTAKPDELHSAVEVAEAAASGRFGSAPVVEALRRVLGRELSRQ
ncbi:hypothetical protein GCM10027589_04440 [Actinocorallia lasiicapitis]